MYSWLLICSKVSHDRRIHDELPGPPRPSAADFELLVEDFIHEGGHDELPGPPRVNSVGLSSVDFIQEGGQEELPGPPRPERVLSVTDLPPPRARRIGLSSDDFIQEGGHDELPGPPRPSMIGSLPGSQSWNQARCKRMLVDWTTHIPPSTGSGAASAPVIKNTTNAPKEKCFIMGGALWRERERGEADKESNR